MSSSQACGGGCDGLNGLPQAPCVSAVCEVIIDFLSICPFHIFDATGKIVSCCFEGCFIS